MFGSKEKNDMLESKMYCSRVERWRDNETVYLHLKPDRVVRIVVKEDAPDVNDCFFKIVQIHGSCACPSAVTKPKKDIEAQ